MAELIRVMLEVQGSKSDVEDFQRAVEGQDEQDNYYPLLLRTLLPQPDFGEADNTKGDPERRWRNQHWGTSRDLDWSNHPGEIEVYLTGEDNHATLTYEFDVAWMAPDAWVESAESKFPKLTFSLME